MERSKAWKLGLGVGLSLSWRRSSKVKNSYILGDQYSDIL